MRHVAIVGSGPAGYYTAEALLKLFGDGVRIDMIDRLPVPYGLIRSGVAPDHQSIKAVSRRYEQVSLSPNVRFLGNVTLGRDVAVDELRACYDAVVLATGAPHDRPLGIPGEALPGVIGSAAFVGWYNGHPDHARLDPPLDGIGAVVIGNGNVALDVARILAKTRSEFAGSDIAGHALDALESSAIRRITLLGRRGPQQIAMTPKELGELGRLSGAAPAVDPADLADPASDAALEPGLRKSVGHIRDFATHPRSAPKTIDFDFFAQPLRIEGDGKVERLIVERTRLDAAGRAIGTGETYAIPCGLVVACIGYRTPSIPGIPYDEALGRFANEEGRIAAASGGGAGALGGLYCVGWARRGPSGTIGTNRPDGYAVTELIAADVAGAAACPGGAALDTLLAARGASPTSFTDWRRIEAAEAARARDGSPREKFVDLAAMLAAGRA